MWEQFSRTERLFGKKAVEQLMQAKVAVFGIGGVGGHALEALVRSGVGSVDIIDNDKVCLSNLNRQIIATHKTLGQYKVDVAEERMKEINPDVVIHKYQVFFCRKRLTGLTFPSMIMWWMLLTRWQER